MSRCPAAADLLVDLIGQLRRAHTNAHTHTRTSTLATPKRPALDKGPISLRNSHSARARAAIAASNLRRKLPPEAPQASQRRPLMQRNCCRSFVIVCRSQSPSVVGVSIIRRANFGRPQQIQRPDRWAVASLGRKTSKRTRTIARALCRLAAATAAAARPSDGSAIASATDAPIVVAKADGADDDKWVGRRTGCGLACCGGGLRLTRAASRNLLIGDGDDLF